MKNEKYYCNRCKRYFDKAKIYEETHNFKNPPYEKIAVCPRCESDDFIKFEWLVEKIDIAEKIIPAIMYLNKYVSALIDLFGDGIVNNDLSNGIGLLTELIDEMYDFLDVEMQRRILKMDSSSEMEKIFTYLKGGL